MDYIKPGTKLKSGMFYIRQHGTTWFVHLFNGEKIGTIGYPCADPDKSRRYYGAYYRHDGIEQDARFSTVDGAVNFIKKTYQREESNGRN